METSVETDLLVNTVRHFVETEMFPYEEEVDRPVKLGRRFFEGVEDIGCELAVVGALFDGEKTGWRTGLFPKGGVVAREEGAEAGSGGHGSDEIAFRPDRGVPGCVIADVLRVEGQAHGLGKRDSSLRGAGDGVGDRPSRG